MKIKLLLAIYYLFSVVIFSINWAGIRMGVEHIIPPTVAYICSFLYMVFIARCQFKLGFFPALAGVLIDVGIRKAVIYFIIPQSLLFFINFLIIRYASSFSAKNDQNHQPPYGLLKLNKIIRFANPAAAKNIESLR